MDAINWPTITGITIVIALALAVVWMARMLDRDDDNPWPEL